MPEAANFSGLRGWLQPHFWSISALLPQQFPNAQAQSGIIG